MNVINFSLLSIETAEKFTISNEYEVMFVLDSEEAITVFAITSSNSIIIY